MAAGDELEQERSWRGLRRRRAVVAITVLALGALSVPALLLDAQCDAHLRREPDGDCTLFGLVYVWAALVAIVTLVISAITLVTSRRTRLASPVGVVLLLLVLAYAAWWATVTILDVTGA